VVKLVRSEPAKGTRGIVIDVNLEGKVDIITNNLENDAAAFCSR
jgi:hypothetical protein